MSRSRNLPRCFPNKFQEIGSDQGVEISKENWQNQITIILKAISEVAKSLDSDGGLYVGTAGIAYMLYYVSCYQPLAAHKEKNLQLAKLLFDRDLQYSSKSEPAEAVSFILGPAGVYCVGAFLGQALENEELMQENIKRFQSLADRCLNPTFLSCGSDELFVGRAGYLCGALALQKRLGIKVLEDNVINAICAVTMQCGLEYSKRHRSSAPLMYAYYGTEYLGAAHGLSSILQMLISCQSFIESDPQAAAKVKEAVDWLLTTQQPNGNFAPAMDELHKRRPAGDELVHWCHGAPGVVYLFAKAYKIWKDDRYLQACLKCGELTWQKGLLTKGPGICHGISGSGYVFLLLYQLTGDENQLRRAYHFASFMFTPDFQSNAATPDNPYSLYEGWAGTVCFLVDLLQPERAQFPFFGIH